MNKKPLIITFSGYARNGKDASALILKEKLEKQNKKVLIMGYGNYVKYIAEKYFGWNGEKDETGRTLLQKLGTDIVRAKNHNYWVDTVIEFVNIFGDAYDYILISDTRFKNEIKRWAEKGYNYIAVHVERLNFENDLTPEQKMHPSERDLDNYNFDYYIESESGLNNLEKEVDSFIEYLQECEKEELDE